MHKWLTNSETSPNGARSTLSSVYVVSKMPALHRAFSYTKTCLKMKQAANLCFVKRMSLSLTIRGVPGGGGILKLSWFSAEGRRTVQFLIAEGWGGDTSERKLDVCLQTVIEKQINEVDSLSLAERNKKPVSFQHCRSGNIDNVVLTLSSGFGTVQDVQCLQTSHFSVR